MKKEQIKTLEMNKNQIKILKVRKEFREDFKRSLKKLDDAMNAALLK